MFSHPNYYKNLRKLARNSELHVRPISGSEACDTDQAISPTRATAPSRRATGPGHKHQASSAKLLKKQATSVKPQAASVKLEAASIKLLDPGPSKKFHAPRTEVLNADKCVVRMFHMEGNLVW